MDITVYPGLLAGTITAIPSKSQAHRLLICAAFADYPTTLICPSVNKDIEATAQCLQALGAKITRTESGYLVVPIQSIPKNAELNCCESGSTLRFMLPIVAGLGVDGIFHMEGRLPARPLSPLWEELERKGCRLSRPTETTLRCEGKLHGGEYTIDGGVSSQFITGLLFALALLNEPAKLYVTGNIESAPYIRMTEEALATFGVSFKDYQFGNAKFHSPGTVTVEGDWSNGAFFLGANALGSQITIEGLKDNSPQGDKAAATILKDLDTYQIIDGRDIPDLIPILAVVAGFKQGAYFQNIGRLRLKESDRIASVAQILTAFGSKVQITDDSMTVSPCTYQGCTIDAQNDHRIAMAAAIGATVSQGPVTILGADCVKKSYPNFWSEFSKLGGKYEQYIR